MLDSETLSLEMRLQLEEAFKKLESSITLSVSPSSHGDQSELLSLLHEVARTSPERIQVKLSESPAVSVPYFEIYREDRPTGISFKGIPGGHEFTSLILAILNADGKGKLPDAAMIARIRALKGPVHLKTYVSLSCENCPDIVQGLNLIASLHGKITHEMIDGSYVQSEVEALGLQGVPSVVVQDRLIHSGKISFLDLLKKLETQFGTETSKLESAHQGDFDVVVIGGGPAGVSSAIYSARKGLKTAIIADRFGGQVQETKGIENMISVPFTEGPKLAAQLAEHLKSYPIEIFEHRRVTRISGDKNKKIELESGESFNANAVIVATGARWRELGIPGEKEHIGQGVAFCAHCDGPFYKGKRVAVVGGGNSGVEAAIDLAGITTEVTLFEFSSQLKADQVLVKKLNSLPNVRVICNAVTQQIIGDGKKVSALAYQDRTTSEVSRLELDGVFVQIGLFPNSQFLEGVVDLNPRGEIVVDEKGRTSVAGIYAAGDVTPIPFKQIVTAMGDGAKVALTAFEDRMRAS